MTCIIKNVASSTLNWAIIDVKTRQPYLGSKSFKTEDEAHIMLNDLLKYHRGTEWEDRLMVAPSIELKAKNPAFKGDRRTNKMHKLKPLDQRKPKENPKDISIGMWI